MPAKKKITRTKKVQHSTAQKVGFGVALTAAAVTAAGGYFLYGSKNAKKNRKSVKSWMFKARAEVLEALEKAEDITEDEYAALIEAVGGAYGTLQNATAGEVRDFKNEMNDHWKKIEKTGVAKQVKRSARKAVKHAKKTARKVTKKVTKSIKKKVARKTTKIAKKPAKKTTKKSVKKTVKKSTKKKVV